MTDIKVNRREFLNRVGVGVAAVPGWTARSYSSIPGANEKLLVGIIGCGKMGSIHLEALLTLQETDNVQVVSVCDIYSKRLTAAATKSGATAFSDYQDLLSQKNLDYAVIATPEHWHHKMALDTLAAGKHVYLEKRMAQTIPQVQEIVREVKKSGLKMQVGVQGMSDETYQVANDYIRSGTLGKVVMAQIDYSRNYADDFWAYDIDPEADPNTNLNWSAWLGPASKQPWDPRRFFQWRRYWDYSGGIATDLFIHRVTRIIKSVGLTFPEHVVASGGTWQFGNSEAEIPDTFNMLCDYPGGPTVSLISSMANDFPVDHVIRGHKATLRFTKEGFIITPQELVIENKVAPEEFRAQKLWSKVYRKKGAEDVILHHQNLQNAIRNGSPLNCDEMLGYYGSVVTSMGVGSFRRKKYLRWDPKNQQVKLA